MKDWLGSLVVIGLLASLLFTDAEPFAVLSNFWPHLGLALLLSSLVPLGRGGAMHRVLGVAVGSFFVVYALAVFDFHPSRLLSSIGQKEKAGQPGASTATAPLKVISFNLMNHNRRRADDLIDFLIAENADFVFIQEAGAIERKPDRLLAHYPYYSGCEPGVECSMMVLSRHPMVDVQRPDVPPGYHRLAIIKTRVGGKIVTLVGLHLTKPLFEGRQRVEIDATSALIAGLEGPVIVAGDFNTAPWSQAMRRFLAGSGLSYGYGYHPTWPTWLPTGGLPIDHIMTGGGLTVRAIEVPSDSIGSNHRPVIALIDWPAH
ncbi:MAG: endonuclease/exonuclease/phosphatase family protein [Alphaproteobacteria bacterium]